MAQIDFSNAVLTPHTYNPVSQTRIGFWYDNSTTSITNSAGTNITQGLNVNFIKDEAKRFIIQYTGTMTASGTAFYINVYGIHWQVSNISFASGDTFVLQINCNLTTN